MQLFLETLASAAGFSAAELISGLEILGPGRHYRVGIADDVQQQWNDYYAERDPLLKALMTGSVPAPFMRFGSAREAVDLEWFRGTELVADWYSQIGGGVWDNCVATFSQAGSGNLMALGFHQDATKGPIDMSEMAKMEVFLPHVQRALLLMETIDVAEAQLTTARVGLDHLSVGVLNCRGDGFVEWANQVGRAHLKRSPSASLQKGRLKLNDPKLQKELARCIREAARGDASRVAAFSVPQVNGPVLQCAVCPAGRSRGLVNETGRAIVFLSDARPDEFSLTVMTALFGFTPAEARVVVELVRGSTPAQISSNLLVSAETVRTHLKSAYLKTETGTQAKLVAHVLGGLGWLREPHDGSA